MVKGSVPRVPSTRQRRTGVDLATGAGFAVALTAFSVPRLDDAPYWHDEQVSVEVATLGTGDLVAHFADVEVNMALYHVVLRGWIAVVGASETATRSLSVVCVGLAEVPARVRVAAGVVLAGVALIGIGELLDSGGVIGEAGRG